MTKNRIETEYFEWLTDLSSTLLQPYGEYRLLSECLYSIEFYSGHGNDADRVEDGLDLRLRFAEESGYSMYMVRTRIMSPCSVLEMMLALAIRCEENIMGEPGIDNSGRWLYEMVESLHLNGMEDFYFDEDYIYGRIQIFLQRRYRRNGDGGLFTVHKTNKDLRDADIWFQMCWYLAEIAEL